MIVSPSSLLSKKGFASVTTESDLPDLGAAVVFSGGRSAFLVL